MNICVNLNTKYCVNVNTILYLSPKIGLKIGLGSAQNMKIQGSPRNISTIAPGRTCLFGDHQDYLGLPVIACAIDRHIQLHALANETGQLIINKLDLGEVRAIDLNEPIDKVEKGDHLLAAVKILKGHGACFNQGYDIDISGNVPINSGVSSSSAVLHAWIQFLVTAFGVDENPTQEFLSKIAYEAEVAFHGAPGGKMDQYSIGLGHIMYLETDDSAHYQLFDEQLPGLIIAESGIPKDTTGVLGELKEKALLAIHQVRQKLPHFNIAEAQKKNLPNLVNYVNDDLVVYLEAAVLNHDITLRALEEFCRPKWDAKKIGALMAEHHNILKEYLNITVPKIDAMIDAATTAGALGSKIVGSGRGGSIVVLVKEGEQENVVNVLKGVGAQDAYPVNVAKGARTIQSNKDSI